MNRLLLLPLFVLLSTSVIAINDTVALNGSSDDVVQVTLNVTLAENFTLMVDSLDVNNNLLYEFPEEIFYDDGDEEQILFNISRNIVFTENATINSTFLISNNLNNNTHEYLIITNVFVDEREDIFIEIINSNYFVNLSTQLLPKSGSLSYSVNGLEGETLSISCDTWLSCPSSKIFNSNNKAEFNINYSVPFSAPLGETVRRVEFSTGNLTLNSNITFNIFDPGIEINTYVFTEDCFVTTADGELTVTLECIEDKEEYDIQRLSRIINRIRADFNATCDPEIVEEYVYLGNIEKEVVSELQSCRETRDNLIDDVESFENSISAKQRELNSCSTTLRATQQQIINNETACLQNVFDTSVRLKNEAEQFRIDALDQAKEFRTETIVATFALLFLFFTALAVFLYFKLAKKNSWGF